MKPETFEIGDSFEDFARKYIFTKKHFSIKYKTPNYETNKDDFIEDTMLPDFQFRCLKTKKLLWIECKFKNKFAYKNKYEICSYNQLKRHQKIKEPVFFLIGYGTYDFYKKQIKKDIELYLVPIKEMYPKMFKNHLEQFKIEKEEIKNLDNKASILYNISQF